MSEKNKALEMAIQLCSICSDWNLDEVEICGEMVNIYDLKQVFKDALVEKTHVIVGSYTLDLLIAGEAVEPFEGIVISPNGTERNLHIMKDAAQMARDVGEIDYTDSVGILDTRSIAYASEIIATGIEDMMYGKKV